MQTVPKGGGVGETKIVQGIWDHSIQLTEKRKNRKAVITDILQKVVKVAVGVLVTTGRNQRRDMERTDPVEALTWRAGQGWNEPLEDGYLSPILDRYQPALASLPPCHLSPDSCSRSISLSSPTHPTS